MFKALKALIVGILAGTALGVLFSPKKGDEIRKNIKKEVKHGGTGLVAIVHTLSDMGKEIGESTKETYEEVSRTEAYKKAKAKTGKFVKSKISAKHRNQAKKAFNRAKQSIDRAKETINKVKNNIASRKEE